MTNSAAYQAGVNAFNAGKKRVPALDGELRLLLKGNDLLPILNDWLRGWDVSNLA